MFLCKTGPVRKEILGQNIAHLNWYEQTLENSTFMSRIRELNSPIVRWPGGGYSQCYNWKTDSCIYFGKVSFGLNIIEIAELCDSIDAEIIMTVNFGTMHASDAKHLVEFCNGPVTSEWGRKRDSLGHPEPLNIRYWEIGNEFYCPMEWLYSWSAQSKRKYFEGGSEERRGRTPILPWSFTQRCYKGDIFISNGSPSQRFYIRFPKVVPGSDTVKIGLDTVNFEIWERVDSFNGVGPTKVFMYLIMIHAYLNLAMELMGTYHLLIIEYYVNILLLGMMVISHLLTL